MLPVTNSTLDPLIPSTASPAIIGSGRPVPRGSPAYTYCIPWIATYRRPLNTGQANTSILGSNTPFMKGLSENITISTTGASPWQWRRICFTFKGNYLIDPFTIQQDSDTISFAHGDFFHNTYNNDSGVFRPMYDLASYYGENITTPSNPGTVPAAYFRLINTMFRGVAAQQNPDSPTLADYINVMTAKTDNTELTVKYDKTITIAAGNDAGMQRNHKRWHPMNKTLVYDTLEQGADTLSSNLSTESKPGMGDYYVVDFFQQRYLADADDGNLIFDPRATLYWHEK